MNRKYENSFIKLYVVNFCILCDNATKGCCTSIVVHNYADDKRIAKFVKATKKHLYPER